MLRKPFRTLIIIICIICPLTNQGFAADDPQTPAWPEFRGPTCDGQSRAANLPLTWGEDKNVTWKTAIHGRAWSTPVIMGNQIWLTTAPRKGNELFVLCVDLKTGRILKDIKLFDVADPKPVIESNTYASPSPVIEPGRVYVHFGSMGTACLDTQTGKTIWQRRDLPCTHLRGPGSSLFLFKDLLITTFDGTDVQYLAALDKKTGKTVWKTDRSTEFGDIDGDFRKAYATPMIFKINDRLQLISPGAKAAMAYDPLTGRELWKVRYAGFSNASRALMVNGLVLINTGFSRAQIWAVRPDGTGDVTDSHVAWKFTDRAPTKATPVVVDGLIFMPSDNNYAFCVEGKTGKTIWKEKLGGQYWASPIHAAGRIYFFNHRGQTTVVRASRTFEVLAVNQLDEGFMASPAITGDTLILRTKTHLYRIDE